MTKTAEELDFAIKKRIVDRILEYQAEHGFPKGIKLGITQKNHFLKSCKGLDNEIQTIYGIPITWTNDFSLIEIIQEVR